jgi:hypothetical protein
MASVLLAAAVVALLTALVAFENGITFGALATDGAGFSVASNEGGSASDTSPSLPSSTSPLSSAVADASIAAVSDAPATIFSGPGVTSNTVLAPYDRINESPTPLAAPLLPQGSWSLLNLLCMVVSLVWAMVLLAGLFGGKRGSNDEMKFTYGSSRGLGNREDGGRRKRFIGRLAGIVVGIVALLVFSLTEDMTLSTTWVDHWSPLMVAFLIVQDAVTLYAVICRGLNEEDSVTFSQRLSWGSSPRA